MINNMRGNILHDILVSLTPDTPDDKLSKTNVD